MPGYEDRSYQDESSFSILKSKIAGIFSGYKNDNNIGISLKESLYNGGADIVNLKQAEVSLRIQQETLRAGKLDAARSDG